MEFCCCRQACRLPCLTAMFFPEHPYIKEIRLTKLSLAVTGTAAAFLICSTGQVAWSALQHADTLRLMEASLFVALAGFLVYGNLCYQVARLGRLRRFDAHRTADTRAQTAFLGVDPPALTILVPSYKEEISVIRQTLLSAALQEYPNKRIVLLLDDPPSPKSRQEQAALWAARSLPFDLQALLAAPHRHVTAALASFRSRPSNDTKTLKKECECMAECLRWAAEWFEGQAKATPIQSHTDAWFVEYILSQPAEACREQAAQWMRHTHHLPDMQDEKLTQHIDDAYSQLAGRFTVEFDVFERKQYCNLSHERNKAMNLNSFLGLMGKRVSPVLRKDGLHLEETSKRHGSRLIPDTPYVITLDADSLLLPRYAATLVRFMEQPEHARIGVAQTPYSAFPNPPGILERTAGATTDIQYLVHQGFTRFGATFWVGANALLKKSALEDICTEERDGIKTVRRYIHDRTVIEDTESTVDLMAKGWSLYNHPERLAYSATPPDFGSLVIQRARWANGGLIIFPKLLSFLRGAPKQPRTFVQAMLQIHYLISLAFAPLSVLLLLIIPFSSDLMSIWMPLAAFPYFALYARDLSFVGYRPIRDLFRVYALNLLLIPVHLTGAVTSMRQAIAGTKIPFKRTPKVSGRTRTSGLDAVLQLLIVGLSAVLGIFYVSQLRWISGMFTLVNAALLLYGIKQFIGFAELREDLILSVRDEMKNAAFHQATAVWHQWTVSCTAFLRLTASQTLRLGSRHAALTLVLALEGLSPSLVGGADRSPDPIQLENQRRAKAEWTLRGPASHDENQATHHLPNAIAVDAMSGQNPLPEGREPLDGMEIAITVDDLPAHGEMPPDMNRRDIGKGVLRALESIRTPPVYGFSNGSQLSWAPESLEVFKDWLESGHLLGNHTFSHMNLALSTADAFMADIVAMDRFLASLSPISFPHKVFRYPYLNEGDTLEKHDRVRNFLENSGYQVAQITIHYDDWAWNNAYVRCRALNDKAKMQWLHQHVVRAARREVRQAQKAAELVAGREVRHILLVHLTAFNALTLDEVLSALQAEGVRFIDLQRAMDDPIYRHDAGPSLSAGPTLLKQLIDTKNLPYPTGPKYPVEQIEAMCKP